MKAIKTAKLTKYYGTSRGIVDLDVEIEKGEFFGFIGPNGSGKSTTIRTILGLISPTSGTAEVLGLDIIKDREKILSKVGYLPSETVFYSGMRVKDALKFSADLRKIDCTSEARVLAERLQLDLDRKVDELSFGNRKKVGIIAALQHKPELIVLDEPTGGLDPLMQKEFFDILKERNSEGATIFLSSHVLYEIERNCTRAAIIRDGKIVACGSVDSLSKTNAKRIAVSPKVDLSELEGIRDVNSSADAVSFLYSGDMNRLISVLSGYDIADLAVTEPDLDEIFLHYYEKEDSAV